ncbi:MAG TPA: hypothetical protein VGI60_14175 [Chthoniobacterales bacterium]
MRKTAFFCLGIWAGGNLLLAIGIVAAMLLFGTNAPSLFILFSKPEIAALDPKALATINGLAVFANACAAAFCVMALALIWRALCHGEIWCIRLLVACAIPLQGLGFASDIYFRHKDLPANVISSVILLLGLFAARTSMTRNGADSPKRGAVTRTDFAKE